jgi:cell division protein FtsL
MAQMDLEHFSVKARPLSAIEVAQEISRTKHMLVTAIIATMIVVVVAALFMTMMA